MLNIVIIGGVTMGTILLAWFAFLLTVGRKC